MSKVLIIGDSHLKRVADVFQFPDNFTIEAQGGAHVNYWLQKKELIKKHDICMLMLGGNNLLAKPSDPIQYKEEMRSAIGQFTQIRNFCNNYGVRLIVWQIINCLSSVNAGFDIIRALNNRLADNKLKYHFRTFSFDEDFLPDTVHMKDWWYKQAGCDLVREFDSAPDARPDLVDLSLPNVN